MKFYLAKFEIVDGEHEHCDAVLILAPDHDAAYKRAEQMQHDTDCYGDNCDVCNGDSDIHPFSYYDGETAARFRGLDEIKESEAHTLETLVSMSRYAA